MSAIDDYHTAKKELSKRKINDTEDAILEAIYDYTFNDVLSHGLHAYSWINGAPVHKGKGWLSFDACCELVGMDPETVREQSKLPSVWRALNRHNGGFN